MPRSSRRSPNAGAWKKAGRLTAAASARVNCAFVTAPGAQTFSGPRQLSSSTARRIMRAASRM